MTAPPTPTTSTADVALIHDYLLVLRGAERTFAAMCDLWASAPIYTLLYDRDGTQGRFESHRIRTSRLQRTGADQARFRNLLPLFPSAVSRLPTRNHRVLISSSSAFAHGVPMAPDAVHVCYCHSPFRYAWFEQERAVTEVSRPFAPALRLLLAGIRRWDRQAAGRVTRYVSNSRLTQARIREFYGRDSVVVHPPVEINRFRSEKPEDYFLVVSEIVRHKRIETAAAAATEAQTRLKVVGVGPDLQRLRARYPKVEWLGRVDDETLNSLYARARAVIVPNIEEFGIAAVEAQAAGRPVLAARAGGTLETVVEGRTGRFFTPDAIPELTRLLRNLDPADFDRDAIRTHAAAFSTETFSKRLAQEVSAAISDGPLSS